MRAQAKLPITPAMRKLKYAMNIQVPGHTVSLIGSASGGISTKVVTIAPTRRLTIVAKKKYLAAVSL